MATSIRRGVRLLSSNIGRSIIRRTVASTSTRCICIQHWTNSPRISGNRAGVSQARKFSTSPEVSDDTEPEPLYTSIQVEVKGHDPTVLNSYEKFFCMAAKELDITVTNVSTPPRIIERYTLLKSVHIYKKHRVQYEARTNFRIFELKHLTGSTADTFLAYLQINLPEGVAMKVTRHRVEALPDHIKPPEDFKKTET